jgi:hypothetical protein
MRTTPLEKLREADLPVSIKKLFKSIEETEKIKLKESIKLSRRKISIHKIQSKFEVPSPDSESNTIPNTDSSNKTKQKNLNFEMIKIEFGNQCSSMSIEKEEEVIKQEKTADIETLNSIATEIDINNEENVWKMFESPSNQKFENEFYLKHFSSKNMSGISPKLMSRSDISPSKRMKQSESPVSKRNARESQRFFTNFWALQGKRARNSLFLPKRQGKTAKKMDQKYARISKSLLDLLKKLAKLHLSFEDVIFLINFKDSL